MWSCSSTEGVDEIRCDSVVTGVPSLRGTLVTGRTVVGFEKRNDGKAVPAIA